MGFCTLGGDGVGRADWRDHLIDHHPGAEHFSNAEAREFFERRTSRPPTPDAIIDRKD
ncbi:hypothetical protein [Sulfobacillus harzensis]|uniref:Uncharacterized protein n=1 Tax=Sulfobacillus harzensis TaxID=2729629 RepID=A0A7Y0L8Q4_9FIRM|nr:hypothetical protein [Sulfobacillus harzensis]NMP25078.1 hypothetical protein [Sulfobacillus harzensis]